MTDRGNCWGPNKLWDETRSWETNLFLDVKFIIIIGTFLETIHSLSQILATLLETIKIQLCVSLSKLWSSLLHRNDLQPSNVQASWQGIDHLTNILLQIFVFIFATCDPTNFHSNGFCFRCESRHHGLKPFSQSCQNPDDC